MCCFSEEIEDVSGTRIFSRAVGSDQLIVYSMVYAAPHELAMVLPIPALPGAGEDAVRFISLEECPDFFEQLERGFAPPPRIAEEDEIGGLLSAVEEETRLQVRDVGAFEASFVPSPMDFGRLDPRFRLPVPIWLTLRHYADWGFAVFKLKPTDLAAVHPMAFTFPTREKSKLFFPTLHLHGKSLEAAALFDHMLYCQPGPKLNWHLDGWEDTAEPASAFVDCEAARALLDLDRSCWRVPLRGGLHNRDTWVGSGEKLPAKAV